MEENSGNFNTVKSIACDDCNIKLDDENLLVTQLCLKTFCLDCVVEHPDLVRLPPDLWIIPPEMSEMAFQTNSTINTLSDSSNGEQPINFGKKIDEFKNLMIDINKLKSILNDEKDKVFILNECLKCIGNILKPGNLNTKSISFAERIKEILSPFIRTMHIASKVLITLPDGNLNSFLTNIHKKIESGGELFTFHELIEDNNLCKELSGKISIWQKKLFFHCLEQNSLENYKELIQFEDLNNIITSIKSNYQKYFMPFLKISDGDLVLMIKLMSSDLLPQFIRLCTGESGTSYKNSEYTFSSEVRKKPSSVKSKDGREIPYMVDIRYKRITHCSYKNKNDDFGTVNYTLESNRGKRLFKKVYVVSDSSGCFDIFMAERDVPPSNCIGEIDNSSCSFDFVNTNGVVIDCGISFHLQQN